MSNAVIRTIKRTIGKYSCGVAIIPIDTPLSLFAASEITAENREEVFRLLDQSVPPLLSFLKEIVKRLL